MTNCDESYQVWGADQDQSVGSGVMWSLVRSVKVCGKENRPTTAANHQHKLPPPPAASKNSVIYVLQPELEFLRLVREDRGQAQWMGHKLTEYNIIIWRGEAGREGGREGGGWKTVPVQLWQTSCMENPMIKMLISSLDNKMKTTNSLCKKNHKQREVWPEPSHEEGHIKQ